MDGKYSIGLDIGVASVGWACMTPDFRVPKYNGRYAMGVREFESAQTAEQKRLQRGTRRRYNRRIKRIQLLQQTINSLFMDDSNFFIETDEKEKHYWRNSNGFEHNSLSETLNHLGMNKRKYPTIYHLRYDLLTGNEKVHPRLIYLALHNLVKYRGHFLHENMNWTGDESATLHTLLPDYLKELTKHQYEDRELSNEDYGQIVNIFTDNNFTNSDKRNQIINRIGKDFKEPISLILGLKSNVASLFFVSDQVDTYKEEKLKISFDDKDITEVLEKLTDDEMLLVEKANAIYQSILLNELLGDANCVAAAKVRDYDQFKEDLRLLQDLYNRYFDKTAYQRMFITSKEKQRKYNNTRDINLLCEFDKFLKVDKYQEKFYKELSKKIEGLQKKFPAANREENIVTQVLEKLEQEQFLRKLKNRENNSIPHQNNVYEAETILINQQIHYPEITNDMIEKVKQIINFRIPYYIGPLIKDSESATFGWSSRKIKESHVMPWNFDEVIDRSKSAESFINRMTKCCAYLINEKVLPKHSLIYEKFEVLNELNGIQIRSNHELPDKSFRLSKEEKIWLIENVFSKYKTVTHKIFKKEISNSHFKHRILDNNTGSLKNIYGTQKEDSFGSSLSTLIDMMCRFGTFNSVDFNMLEEIIYWITVFEEKEIIETKIREKYPNIGKKQIKNLVSLNYSGWGKLSKRLINEFPVDETNHMTMLEIMENEPKVFMEVIGTEKYNLNKRIAACNLKANDLYTKIKYQDVAELQGSPALKKGIWQAISIIEELVETFGEPENIMIEFAREDGKKERTIDRKKQFKELEKAISREEKELKQFLKENTGYGDAKYKDERLFLYITQQGKCLYSGETLNVNRLQDYEVDHILPRSFVKDDSIHNNLALVKKRMNQVRGNYKMPLEVINNQDKVKQKLFWKKLRENKLITEQKYRRLLKESFSDQDKEGFFAKQLVETRQITKHVKDLLNERFENTDIHAVNASIVTGLRKHSGIIKLRNLNNKHHAVDAAVMVLIIQFIINRYGVNFLNFDFRYQEARKKWRNMLQKYKKKFFLFSDIDECDKFVHFQTGEILTGRQFLSVLNDEMPWQTTKKIGTDEAAFYKQTLYSPKVKSAKYQSGKTTKGVYDEVKKYCTYLISYTEVIKGDKKVLRNDFVDLNVIEKYQLEINDETQLALYLAEKIAKGKIVAAKIHTRILKHQLINYRGHFFTYVSGGEMHNAKQLVLGKSLLSEIYKILNNDEKNLNPIMLSDTFNELVCVVNEKYGEFVSQNTVNKMHEYVEQIVDKESFVYALDELFKTTSAGATRSSLFEARYRKKLEPSEVNFIHQSITGLHFRKQKSYKNELWNN